MMCSVMLSESHAVLVYGLIFMFFEIWDKIDSREFLFINFLGQHPRIATSIKKLQYCVLLYIMFCSFPVAVKSLQYLRLTR